jgi:hypothetical protein
MKYAVTEEVALDLAQHLLTGCADGVANTSKPHCPVIRTYIKQRWGY